MISERLKIDHLVTVRLKVWSALWCWKYGDEAMKWFSAGVTSNQGSFSPSSPWCWQTEPASTTCSSTSWRAGKQVRNLRDLLLVCDLLQVTGTGRSAGRAHAQKFTREHLKSFQACNQHAVSMFPLLFKAAALCKMQKLSSWVSQQ